MPHHSSFIDVGIAAAAGCDRVSSAIWSARLHHPQIGTYDVDLKQARDASGPVRLMRVEERLVLKLGGSPADDTSYFSCAVNVQTQPPSTSPCELI